MIVNKDTLAGLFKSFSAIFQEAFEKAQPLWTQLATIVPSITAEENYAWIGTIPTMREWVGARVVKNLIQSGYTVLNKEWESTVGVKRPHVEDDKLGIYRAAIQQMGDATRLHPDKLIFDLLKNGNTNLCYDGKAFFATDHPMGTGTKSNALSGAQSALSTSTTGFGDAMASIKSMQDDEGEPLDVGTGFLLVVPPALEEAGRKVLNNELIGNGETNPWRGAAALMVAPRLAGADTVWYLLAIGKALRPFIFQMRQEPEFTAKDNPEDENVFKNNEYLYGTYARYNAGYGLWQLAIRNAGS